MIDLIKRWPLVAVLIAIFLGGLGTLWMVLGPQEWLRTVERWQTLYTGFMAIVAAVIGYRAISQQVSLQQRFNAVEAIESVAQICWKIEDWIESVEKKEPFFDFYFETMKETVENIKVSEEYIVTLNRSGYPNASRVYRDIMHLAQYIVRLREKGLMTQVGDFEKVKVELGKCRNWSFRYGEDHSVGDIKLWGAWEVTRLSNAISGEIYEALLEEHMAQKSPDEQG